MLTTFRQSYKTLVQPENDDLPVGWIIDIVVNPNNGLFEAFWVNTPHGKKLLLPKDIVFWNADQITISDQNDLADPGSLPRLNKIFEQECPLLKTPVWDEAHQKIIGRVVDFTFDTISPRLLALAVRGGWLGFRQHQVPQHRIVRIQPERITVNSAALKTEAAKHNFSHQLPVLEVPDLDRPSQSRKKD